MTSIASRSTVALAAAFAVLAAGAAAWAAPYEEGAVSNGGTLKGTVVLDGVAPPPKRTKVTKDNAACGESVLDESLLVSRSGDVAFAVVELGGLSKGKRWSLPVSFTYDQKGCAFSPHVMAIRPGAAGQVNNSDAVKHNVHTLSKGIFNVNKTLAPGSALGVARDKIRKAGKVRVQCDLHDWMGGWWIVAETPYVAVTGSDGSFEIKDIPPGRYKVAVWQERLGETQRDVEIKPGAATALRVAMKAR
ncbi:MAG: hypothetical protein HY423_07765 [Candidatus Lambdaproteobacteria bacterium]|nr:hypothetical protein [Candidatus Lambdaproteobacteria bacterium]